MMNCRCLTNVLNPHAAREVVLVDPGVRGGRPLPELDTSASFDSVNIFRRRVGSIEHKRLLY